MNSYEEHPIIKERKADPLLTPGEVAKIFRVNPKTITRWAAAGKIKSLTLPSGHRRFSRSAIMAMLNFPE